MHHVLEVYVIASDGETEREAKIRLTIPNDPIEASTFAKAYFAEALAALIVSEPASPWNWHVTMEVECHRDRPTTEEEFTGWLANQVEKPGLAWSKVTLSPWPFPPLQEKNDATE